MSGASPSSKIPVRTHLLEEGKVLGIVLDRPKGNVLDTVMMQSLADVLAAHANQRHLRLVFLRGAGGHFSFGASVEEHRRDQAAGMLELFHCLIRQFAAYPIPTAAVVEGSCLGGGFELALCAHFLFATPTARFGCPEIKLGVFPPVLAAIGGLRLGSFLAERLLLTGQILDAGGAAQTGLLTRLFDAAADPEESLLAWYRDSLAGLSAYSLRCATEASRTGSGLLERLEQTLEEIERQYLEALVPSHDGNEGIQSFLERRKPVWEDR